MEHLRLEYLIEYYTTSTIILTVCFFRLTWCNFMLNLISTELFLRVVILYVYLLCFG